MHIIAIGEIFLKGKNRILFERKLIKNIKSALNLKENDLIKLRNRYIIKNDENIENIRRVFGVTYYSQVKEAKLNNLHEVVYSLVRNEKTFRISAKKSELLKKSSTEINEELGGYILDRKPNLKVNLETPELEIKVEELRNTFFVYKTSDIKKGLGGLPVGTSGFAHLIVQDEIKSTVAGFLLMKRGCVISLSKDLPLLHKFVQGYNLRTREQKEHDVTATDETFEDLKVKEENKLTLRPLIGYSEKEIKEIYNKIKNN